MATFDHSHSFIREYQGKGVKSPFILAGLEVLSTDVEMLELARDISRNLDLLEKIRERECQLSGATKTT